METAPQFQSEPVGKKLPFSRKYFLIGLAFIVIVALILLLTNLTKKQNGPTSPPTTNQRQPTPLTTPITGLWGLVTKVENLSPKSALAVAGNTSAVTFKSDSGKLYQLLLDKNTVVYQITPTATNSGLERKVSQNLISVGTRLQIETSKDFLTVAQLKPQEIVRINLFLPLQLESKAIK